MILAHPLASSSRSLCFPNARVCLFNIEIVRVERFDAFLLTQLFRFVCQKSKNEGRSKLSNFVRFRALNDATLESLLRFTFAFECCSSFYLVTVDQTNFCLKSLFQDGNIR